MSRLFPRHKARPDQAGFVRRGLALAFDTVIIGLISLLIYLTIVEIKALATGEPGIIAQASQAFKEGAGFSIRMREDEADEMFNIIKEYFISLLYFVLFFRFGGRTPGKRIFRLKVVDLEGKPRLGWYQCFERAHGYVCSGLFASLGFWQVLWNKKGLAMHDKIAGTTVVKLPKKERPKKAKKTRRGAGKETA